MNAVKAERRRTSWMVFGSVLTGLATALFLVLGPLAGGTDGVITGGFLTGFAVGWTLLLVLTRRFTASPQPWAGVPAGVLGLSGIALMVCQPGPVAMERLNWLWPLPVLVMAGWAQLRIRAGLTGAARWLLVPVVGALALFSVGAGYENIASVRDRQDDPPGKTYRVNGHELHLWCVGTGRPTVVLENGLGEVATSWARVLDQVSPTTRVCAHDRAGQGWSEPVPVPADARAAAHDLHALLAAAGEKGPFVVVGHSTGGPHSLVFADEYPHEVAALVLLDATSPDQFTILPAYAGQYALMRRGYAAIPTLDHIGLFRVASLISGPDLPGEAGAQTRAASVTARAATSARNELAVIRDLLARARRVSSLGAVPLVVVTAEETRQGTEGWSAAQKKFAALSSNRLQLTVKTSHAGLLLDEAGARGSASAIERALAAVRDHTALSNS